jgi:hypothetical protein
MRLTSLQHRKIANLLRQKAAKQPPNRAQRMHQLAAVHLGLARAQEESPSLAPAARHPRNLRPPSGQRCIPRLVIPDSGGSTID